MCFMVFGVLPNLWSNSLILAFTAISILLLLYVVFYVCIYMLRQFHVKPLHKCHFCNMLFTFFINRHLNCSEFVAFHNKECCKIIFIGTSALLLSGSSGVQIFS